MTRSRTTKVSSGGTPLLPRTEEKVHRSGRTSSRPTPQDSQPLPASALNSDSFWSFPPLGGEQNQVQGFENRVRLQQGEPAVSRSDWFQLQLDVLHHHQQSHRRSIENQWGHDTGWVSE